ncbi:hypothetical protein Aau02nite_49860 [Amorphoplanes auranticolor]|uniref:Uncharacterized protein n=1 Tax=Actinoplanes auranticolor TaxID=47988 RepID=A0A919VQV1_9ACTN|nr:hypothetical protein Aau02nite_49860 [Actinoplanes auranticolor]
MGLSSSEVRGYAWARLRKINDSSCAGKKKRGPVSGTRPIGIPRGGSAAYIQVLTALKVACPGHRHKDRAPPYPQ